MGKHKRHKARARSGLFAIVLALVAAGSLGAAASLIVQTNQPSALLDPQSNPASQPGSLGDAALIGAVGLVEPSSQSIKIGTDISGTVTDVLVTPGATVKRGQPLFILDRRMAEANLAQRQRERAAAQARLTMMREKRAGYEADVEAAKAAVAAEEADLADAEDLLRIAGELSGSGAVAGRDLTRRMNVVRRSKAKVVEARSRLQKAESDMRLYDEPLGGAAIRVEMATVDQAQAAVTTAETELALRTVRAPSDGTMLQVNVQPGEFAQAGVLTTPLLVLGRIDPLYVRVEVDEADIGKLADGTPAVGSARGDSMRKYRLEFVRNEPLIIPKRSLTGDVTERVDTRVMQVLYAVRDGDHTLRPGQQLDVFIERTAQPIAVSAR
ncbi:biotin/lipoyl-binding protein [Microbacteriaceae bacterium K1510]|nr:biotin/lipoyl-binding protein [Microbacteriaceae bacterium K1510]